MLMAQEDLKLDENHSEEAFNLNRGMLEVDISDRQRTAYEKIQIFVDVIYSDCLIT